MASLSDILTALKNGVIAINGLVKATDTVASDIGTPTLFYRGAAALANATLYTCPITNTAYITDINICNTSGVAITATLCAVPSGGTASAANALFYTVTVPAYATVQWTGKQVLTAGGTIQGYASSTACTFSISGGLSL